MTYAEPTGTVLAVQGRVVWAGIIEMSPYQTNLVVAGIGVVAFEHGYIKIELPAPLASNVPGSVGIYRDPGKGKTPETIVPVLPPIHAMRQQAMTCACRERQSKPPCEAPKHWKYCGWHVNIPSAGKVRLATQPFATGEP